MCFMIRKLQIALLVLLAVAVLLFLYRSSYSPAPQPVPPNPSAIETPAAPFSDADFATHVEQLKKKLPSADFTIVIQPPFVVVGDEPAATVREHSQHTVKWAVDKLKQEYFSSDPKEILDIWLFKDAASYEENVQLLFGEK